MPKVRKRLQTVRRPAVGIVAKAETIKRKKVGRVKEPASVSNRERAGFGKRS